MPWSLRAQARLELGQVESGFADAERALALEPTDAAAQADLRAAFEKFAASAPEPWASRARERLRRTPLVK